MGAAFTPGPWTLDEDAFPYSPPAKVIALPDGTVIAEALGNDGHWPESEPEVAANARLIAAAPDLYRELTNAVVLLRAAGVQETNNGTIRAAEAILAKARGEQ